MGMMIFAITGPIVASTFDAPSAVSVTLWSS